VDLVYEGLPLEHLNVGSRPIPIEKSVPRHSHIRLRRDEYEAAVRGLGGAP
jgi:hypothetical protein